MGEYARECVGWLTEKENGLKQHTRHRVCTSDYLSRLFELTFWLDFGITFNPNIWPDFAAHFKASQSYLTNIKTYSLKDSLPDSWAAETNFSRLLQCLLIKDTTGAEQVQECQIFVSPRAWQPFVIPNDCNEGILTCSEISCFIIILYSSRGGGGSMCWYADVTHLSKIIYNNCNISLCSCPLCLWPVLVHDNGALTEPSNPQHSQNCGST